ncbi:MAG TPA: NAD-dependent epimerase/dehydratase family protein [Candidatus Didemnitutus sp.]|jgi:nucleoside-diphosphate-sugar epimerase
MSWLNGKTLTILGCGYVGTALATRALREGAQVSALTRNRDTGATLAALGCDVVVEDLASDAWHRDWAEGADAVVVCVGSGGPSLEEYRRSYVDGVASVQRWLRMLAEPPAAGIFTSSTSVYPQSDGVVVDERADTTDSSAHGAILREAENRWHTSTLARSVVLRLAGIYGPGRHQLLDQLRSGATEMRGGRQRLNLAHRDDVVSAILACLTADFPEGSRTYNIADGNPGPRDDVIAWLARRLGLPLPQLIESARRTGEPVRDRVISSAALQSDTRWCPLFPDFRAGYESILGQNDAVQPRISRNNTDGSGAESGANLA